MLNVTNPVVVNAIGAPIGMYLNYNGGPQTRIQMILLCMMTASFGVGHMFLGLAAILVE